ncbi:gamma-mobile-trio protein GmtX [Paraburkholderia terricola]|uniref:Uncharacterized protein n=1 Tax=Paraburkholderia terricola TaxID=169427 RepID=A0ABU1LTJ2_9BURK|nr:gamma-mobile-trio protein GmtX [Paraburkholderia terricola]MDR6410023.1 hypothetical protein [Paraburkholderia terricola]MDR6481184.1 hypothetical protein [Paraburkholderia terricola]
MTSQPKNTAPDILRDARQLYQSHKKSATKATKVINLDKLWEVLESILEDGGRDYSLAEIGRRLEKIDGPKTQSLRNAQGAHYREIITAFANAVSGSTRYVAKTKSNVEHALELITDPSIRATLRVALDEAKRLKVVNDNLHAAFKTLTIGTSMSVSVTPSTKATAPEPPSPVVESSKPELAPRLVNALKKGIDKTRLAQQGLHVAEDGSIQNDHGDKLFPPGFVTGIEAVVGN